MNITDVVKQTLSTLNPTQTTWVKNKNGISMPKGNFDYKFNTPGLQSRFAVYSQPQNHRLSSMLVLSFEPYFTNLLVLRLNSRSPGRENLQVQSQGLEMFTQGSRSSPNTYTKAGIITMEALIRAKERLIGIPGLKKHENEALSFFLNKVKEHYLANRTEPTEVLRPL